jgi:hypothetical protein
MPIPTTIPAATRISTLTSRARAYPCVRALAIADGLAGTPASSSAVRPAAIVARIASPTEIPICRAVFKSPDASPASSRATPPVTATATGVIASPIPRPHRANGPSRSAANPLPGVIRASQARPTAAVAVPMSRSGRGPQRVTVREAICDPNASRNVIGRNATPATSGL